MKAVLRRAVLLWHLVLFALFFALVMPAVAFAQDGGDVIDPNTDLGMWSLLVGVLVPALVAIIQQPRWPDWFRAAVGVGASVVAGFVTTWLTESGALWDQGMVHAMLLVGVASWASYQSFWRPTRIAPGIEAKTALTPGPPSP